MKPEDLKSPFAWDARRVLLQDRVWYVPDYYDHYQEFTFPGWKDPLLFGNENPVKIEYCSGNGTWIVAKAEENPQVNWVAVEKQFFRARKIWARMKNRQLNNLLIVCGEASTVTRHYIPSKTVSEVFINFPDPWPKARHAKHRLIQPAFIQEIGRILKEGHHWTFVTDDPDYSQLLLEEMAPYKEFVPSFPSPHYVTDLPGYGSSYFEELWREKGRDIRYHRFCKSEIGSR